jgi:hypothetical protein
LKTISLLGEYLTNQVMDTGQFVYRTNLNPDVKPKPKYNILRHAGAMYALADYYRSQPNIKILDALHRAAQFMITKTLAPLPSFGTATNRWSEYQAIWSLPEINGTRAPRHAKLGGSGLGLVALLSLEEIRPAYSNKEMLEQIANFILFMQREDGSFFCKYVPSTGGKKSTWTSLYYPGEAALGLAMMFEYDENLKWLRGAASALNNLADECSRWHTKAVPADHWALIATARIWPYHEYWSDVVAEDVLIKHAVQICDHIISEQQDDGGFVADGRIAPTSTRLEGLIAMLQFMPQDRIEQAIGSGIEFLLKAQIYDGAIPRAIAPLPDDGSKGRSSFNRRVTEIRIDYVQHALSALLGWHRLKECA